jgi:phenylalanyl-tRNA synthetase beta chain
LIETYAANRHHFEGPLRLFEIGFEYLPVEADLPHERTVLCAVLGGARETRWPVQGRSASEALDFFDAKGAAEAILGTLGVATEWRPATDFGLLEGHTARIVAGQAEVGVVAQVHPDTAARFDVDEPLFLLELWPEALVGVLPERPAYTPPSRFPEVRQDIALVVDEDTAAGRIVEVLRSHRSGNVRIGGEVFDEYRGAGLPPGKKSLAVRLRFQASDRTLTDDDVARIRGGLLTRLERETGATLRA